MDCPSSQVLWTSECCLLNWDLPLRQPLIDHRSYPRCLFKVPHLKMGGIMPCHSHGRVMTAILTLTPALTLIVTLTLILTLTLTD